MSLDLSAQALVNASSGLFFVAIGAFALFAGRGERWPRAVGAYAVCFGAFFTVVNLWPRDDALPYGPVVVAGIVSVALAIAGVVLTVEIARGVSARRRVLLAAFAVAIAYATALLLRALWNEGAPRYTVPVAAPSARAGFLILLAPAFVAVSATAAFLGACALRHAEGRSPRDQDRMTVLALGIGTYWAFYASRELVGFARIPALPVEHLLTDTSASLLAAMLLWATGLRGTGSRQARNVLLALLAVALLGMLVNARFELDATRDLGVPGIIRTAGALLLAVAILKRDLLGVPLPDLSARRGPLVASALAALLIVAQIAQNFLSAQYGLLMGGVVAGALLIAARPIERALEGRPSEPRAAGDGSAKERSFLAAARKFHRDGVISREEERELTILAEHLGIPASRAYELRDEVEREGP